MFLFATLLVGTFFILAAVLTPFVGYFADCKHLREFPSPSFANLTSLWRVYHNVHYRHFLAVHEAHQKLGTHVRIAPNHVSISDPQALTEIYGHCANFLRDAWYDGGAGEYRHMADSRVKLEHQKKRKMLAHLFAQKAIANLEPVMAETTAVLVTQIDNHIASGKAINMRRYLNSFTRTPEGKTSKVPFIKSLHYATIINTLLGIEAGLLPITKRLFSNHRHKKTGVDHENIIYHNTKLRFRDNHAEDNDISSKMMKYNKDEELNLTVGEVLAECSVMMNAGTDTTTSALTSSIYLIYKHPEIFAKLRNELDGATGTPEVPAHEDLAKLSYLKACIEEALRLRPPSSMGLPRIVPKGGRWIAGQFVDEDVTVSVPTYTVLRDRDTFENPESYYPDRWLTDDRATLMKMGKAHLPFSTGPRACIGRNIAYFEQLLVIGTLVRLCGFSFESEDFQLRTLERFDGNPDQLLLNCRRRII